MDDELLIDLDAARVGGTIHQGHMAGGASVALASPNGLACDPAPRLPDGTTRAGSDATSVDPDGLPAPDGLCGPGNGATVAEAAHERCIGEALAAGVLPRRNGLPHHMKPVTEAQKARFAAIWADLEVPLAEIAYRYRAAERSIQNWRTELGLPPRDQLRDQRSRRRPWAVRAAGWQAGLPAVTSAGPVEHTDPLADAEIAAALADLGDEARRIGPGTDLAAVNRKLARLSLLVATKAPAQTWDSIEASAAAMARATTWMRKVESELPAPEADQAQLRRDAAARLMHELKGVLTSEEQKELARLVRAGADRMQTRSAVVPHSKERPMSSRD